MTQPEMVDAYEPGDLILTLESIANDLEAAMKHIDEMAITLPGKVGDAFDMIRLTRITVLEAATEITNGGNDHE